MTTRMTGTGASPAPSGPLLVLKKSSYCNAVFCAFSKSTKIDEVKVVKPVKFETKQKRNYQLQSFNAKILFTGIL